MKIMILGASQGTGLYVVKLPPYRRTASVEILIPAFRKPGSD